MSDILALLASADSLLTSHVEGGETPDIVTTTVTARKLDGNPDDKGTAKVKGSANGKGSKGKVPNVAPPPPATAETAAVFLAALRRAGFRPVKDDDGSLRLDANGAPVMLCDRSKVREDEASALLAFVGYSKGLPHGTQLENARRRALILTRPDVGQDKPSHTPREGGVVFGVPQPAARFLGDLRAKHRTLLDAAIALEKSAGEKAAAPLYAAARKLDDEVRRLEK